VALAFMAAIEDVGRFRRMRDIGGYLGLTPRRYQSGETDVMLGISRQGDAMARHYNKGPLPSDYRRSAGRSVERWLASRVRTA
jgi:transposase